MKNHIITIGRQFGSGGRTIGRMVAERLNIPFYDSEFIQEITQKSGFATEYILEESEYAAFGLSAFFNNRYAGINNQDKIWQLQKDLIVELAEKSPCVIVGRCADYILNDTADCLKVFISASMKHREERIVREYGERPESPEQRLKNKDKRRAAYYRFYTDMEWGRAANYHICFDSGKIGIARCTEIIALLYTQKN